MNRRARRLSFHPTSFSWLSLFCSHELFTPFSLRVVCLLVLPLVPQYHAAYFHRLLVNAGVPFARAASCVYTSFSHFLIILLFLLATRRKESVTNDAFSLSARNFGALNLAFWLQRALLLPCDCLAIYVYPSPYLFQSIPKSVAVSACIFLFLSRSCGTPRSVCARTRVWVPSSCRMRKRVSHRPTLNLCLLFCLAALQLNFRCPRRLRNFLILAFHLS